MATTMMMRMMTSKTTSTSSSSSSSSSATTTRKSIATVVTTRNERASTMRTRAIDPQIALAVAQQNLSLALVLGAEGVLNSQRMAPDFVGRPNLPALAPGLGGCAAAFALINSDNDVFTPVGLGVGALACLYVIKIEFDRFNETKDDPLDWPGPKVFPGGLMLFGLLQFITNAQGFMREI
jgi:hypothetical protein